jgi:hypothetical protein
MRRMAVEPARGPSADRAIAVGVADRGRRGARARCGTSSFVLIENTPAARGGARVRLATAHHAAGVRFDRARQPGLGADRRVGRAAAARAQIVQPIAQFMAAFPANLLFPIVVYGIVAWKLNPDIWLSPLMILGTQWYILFNVIAGASAIPAEMRYVGGEFRVTGWLWWRKVALPAVLPFYVTGAITASGGSWNASHRRRGRDLGRYPGAGAGLGAYIAERPTAGDFPPHRAGHRHHEPVRRRHQSLFWRPLYYYAERKYRLT